MKTIIGLTGLLAAGKGTVVEYLKNKHKAISFRFSDPFRESLGIFDLPISRENMQDFSTLMRQRFGENVLARAIAKKAQQISDGLVVIDGVRRLTDIENLMELPEFHLVALIVDQHVRFERCVARSENNGDKTMTFERFQERDTAEAEKQIPEVMSGAKFTIDNNGTVEELYQKIDEVVESIAMRQ
jgi:dephospho-CoA kinase